MALSIFKNEIRVALQKYHRELIDILQKYPNGQFHGLGILNH